MSSAGTVQQAMWQSCEARALPMRRYFAETSWRPSVSARKSAAMEKSAEATSFSSLRRSLPLAERMRCVASSGMISATLTCKPTRAPHGHLANRHLAARPRAAHLERRRSGIVQRRAVRGKQGKLPLQLGAPPRHPHRNILSHFMNVMAPAQPSGKLHANWLISHIHIQVSASVGVTGHQLLPDAHLLHFRPLIVKGTIPQEHQVIPCHLQPCRHPCRCPCSWIDLSDVQSPSIMGCAPSRGPRLHVQPPG